MLKRQIALFFAVTFLVAALNGGDCKSMAPRSSESTLSSQTTSVLTADPRSTSANDCQKHGCETPHCRSCIHCHLKSSFYTIKSVFTIQINVCDAFEHADIFHEGVSLITLLRPPRLA